MSGIANHYLLDTNILIYYFNGESTVRPIVDEILNGYTKGFYCPITWTELLAYPELTPEEAEKIRQFLRLLTVIPFTEVVLEQAAKIRRNFRTPLPDALIAACTLETACTLVTRNTKDFENITHLQLLNPFALSSPT